MNALFILFAKYISLLVLLASPVALVAQKREDLLPDNGHCYCTVTDNIYFSVVTHLIGSIHKNDFEKLNVILVYDIGMSEDQKEFLSRLEKVRVIPIERVNPHIIDYFWIHPNGKTARGWYTWKPVAIKQASDELPYFLFIDAGTTVLKPMNLIFDHIREHGYFFMGAGHAIEPHITEPVIEHFSQLVSSETMRNLLSPETPSISAGLFGVSHKLRDSFIIPSYKQAFDTHLFEDDGSARLGFGAARPEQILFSIFVYLAGYRVYPNHCYTIKLHNNDVPLEVSCCCSQHILTDVTVYQSRWDTGKGYTQYLRFNSPTDTHNIADLEHKHCTVQVWNPDMYAAEKQTQLVASLEHKPGGTLKNDKQYAAFLRSKNKINA